jgi:hypothetical protein
MTVQFTTMQFTIEAWIDKKALDEELKGGTSSDTQTRFVKQRIEGALRDGGFVDSGCGVGGCHVTANSLPRPSGEIAEKARGYMGETRQLADRLEKLMAPQRESMDWMKAVALLFDCIHEIKIWANSVARPSGEAENKET